MLHFSQNNMGHALTSHRHGHLMLFDDEEQLEVRHVVSLAHHSVSCYSGGEETPEGELFIKRNALCLARRTDVGEITPDGKPSKPFFLYSENCSAKEDFYFAMLRNQERNPDSKYNPPVPLQYDVKDIITLVQRLHSSEEQLQTRWINAVIGRIFLGLYKTPEVINFIRSKITKKISRVKTPSFLSKISLRHLDMGEAAPVITNPLLKDLTVDGEMVVEADVRYSGNFRIEVATTARIDLGSRFKAREVNLLLAVLLKRVEGHAMIRIKPPPSNRLWITFSTMPKVDMHVEPIVSARQITYTLILRQIENRIKEVVAESLVFPNWDDFPFFATEGKPWRGGIFTDNSGTPSTPNAEVSAAQDGDVDELANIESEKVEHSQSEDGESILDLPQMEKSMTTPLVDASPQSTLHSRKSTKSMFNMGTSRSNGSSTSIDTKSSAPEVPKVLRAGAFASVSTPSVSTDATHADAFKQSATPPEHSHAMAAVAALSHSPPSAQMPTGSPSRPSRLEKGGSLSSTSSRESGHLDKDLQNDLTPQPSPNPPDLTPDSESIVYPPSPASMSNASLRSEAPSTKSFGYDPRRENSTSSSGKSATSETKRLSLAAVTNAAATAKKWGWNALQRQGEHKSISEESPRPLVMGRGQPLPPPGMPLPPPDKKTKTAPIPVPKRKPIPPPNLQPNSRDARNDMDVSNFRRHPVPPPPLPDRPNKENKHENNSSRDDGIFVVAAPAADSEPSTPMTEQTLSYMPPWVDDVDDEDEEKVIVDDQKSAVESPASAGPPRLPRRRPHQAETTEQEVEPPSPKSGAEPPRLPKRRTPARVFSTSPEEDSHQLPTWLAAQEGEARARSTFVDEDAGL
jgi:hypothetical protein